MKNLIIITIGLILVLSLSISAQQAYQKGSLIVDGQAYYLKTGGDAYADSYQMNFDLAIGKAVSDGLFVGSSFSIYAISVGNYDDVDWRAGGFLRYYFNTKDPGDILPDKPVNPFVSFALKFSYEESTTLFSLEPTAGINFLLTNTIGLEVAAKYSFDKYSASGNSVSGYNLMIGAGFSKFIN